MKKLILITAALCFYLNTQAQLQKGRMLLGFNFNYFQNSQNNHSVNDTLLSGINSYKNNYKTLNATLNFGYFVTNHVAIGLTGQNSYGYYLYVSKNGTGLTYSENDNKQINNLCSGGAFVRFYQMLGKSRFAFFTEVRALYQNGASNETTTYIRNSMPDQVTKAKITTTGFLGGIRPGVTYFINTHFGIEATLGNFSYNIQNAKNFQEGKLTSTSKTNTVIANVSITSFFIGLSYYFGGKKESKTTTEN